MRRSDTKGKTGACVDGTRASFKPLAVLVSTSYSRAVLGGGRYWGVTSSMGRPVAGGVGMAHRKLA